MVPSGVPENGAPFGVPEKKTPVGRRMIDGCPECHAYLSGREAETMTEELPTARGLAEPIGPEAQHMLARQDSQAAIGRTVLSLTARREPLSWLKTMLAVWVGVTLAGITLALLGALASVTILSAALNDVTNDATTSDVDPGTYDFPTDIPTDIP